jgi:hypothetical protein
VLITFLSLSLSLTHTSLLFANRVVEMLPEILNYAKIQFLKTHEAASGVVELCDTFLSHVNLLASIVKLRTNCAVSLTDFADPTKARYSVILHLALTFFLFCSKILTRGKIFVLLSTKGKSVIN